MIRISLKYKRSLCKYTPSMSKDSYSPTHEAFSSLLFAKLLDRTIFLKSYQDFTDQQKRTSKAGWHWSKKTDMTNRKLQQTETRSKRGRNSQKTCRDQQTSTQMWIESLRMLWEKNSAFSVFFLTTGRHHQNPARCSRIKTQKQTGKKKKNK